MLRTYFHTSFLDISKVDFWRIFTEVSFKASWQCATKHHWSMIGFNERLRPITSEISDHLFFVRFRTLKNGSFFQCFFPNKKRVSRKERLMTTNINTVVVSGSPNRYRSGIEVVNMPIGWLYATYHPLGEPETTIDSINCPNINEIFIKQRSVKNLQDQLVGVKEVQATQAGAFAALLTNGSVVTWGDPYVGHLDKFEKWQVVTDSCIKRYILWGLIVGPGIDVAKKWSRGWYSKDLLFF